MVSSTTNKTFTECASCHRSLERLIPGTNLQLKGGSLAPLCQWCYRNGKGTKTERDLSTKIINAKIHDRNNAATGTQS